MTDPRSTDDDRTAPPPPHEDPPAPAVGGAVGGLLFVVVAAAMVVQAATYAHATASVELGVGPMTGVEADIEWSRLLDVFAAQASFFPAILLAVSSLGVRRLPWGEQPASARATLVVVFPLGLVVAACGAYAFGRGLSGEETGIGVFGGSEPGFFSQFGSVVLYLASAALAGHAAWTAFGRFPLSGPPTPAPAPASVPAAAAGPSDEQRHDDLVDDGAWAPPPAETDPR